MTAEFKINYANVLFGAIGLFIGYLLNVYANKVANQQLLDQLKAELANINQQQITGRSLPGYDQRKAEIEGAIKVLQK